MTGGTDKPEPTIVPMLGLEPGLEPGLEIVLVGAHMAGLPLNAEITGLGGIFARAVSTAPCYRLYALPGGPPVHPGLLRVPDGEGAVIAVEVWTVPATRIGALLAVIPAPLGLGTLVLADGTTPKGFLAEAEGLRGAQDISRFGGWRAFLDAGQAAPASREPGAAMTAPDTASTPSAASPVDVAAALFGVTMQPDWRAAALASFATLEAAATLLAGFALADEAEPGPVFVP